MKISARTACYILVLLFVAGCTKPIETTGLITQETTTDNGLSIEALKQMAANDPAAAYDMGLRYLRGDGIEKNSYKGIESLRAAATRGDLKAQAALGKIYMSGMEEMGADPQEAKKWLQLASARGDKESAILLKKVKDIPAGKRPFFSPPAALWYYHLPYRLYWHHGSWLYR